MSDRQVGYSMSSASQLGVSPSSAKMASAFFGSKVFRIMSCKWFSTETTDRLENIKNYNNQNDIPNDFEMDISIES